MLRIRGVGGADWEAISFILNGHNMAHIVEDVKANNGGGDERALSETKSKALHTTSIHTLCPWSRVLLLLGDSRALAIFEFHGQDASHEADAAHSKVHCPWGVERRTGAAHPGRKLELVPAGDQLEE